MPLDYKGVKRFNTFLYGFGNWAEISNSNLYKTKRGDLRIAQKRGARNGMESSSVNNQAEHQAC